jgi:TetR/AcrR family transcriptional repressor of lmrAB and yxaGH operons
MARPQLVSEADLIDRLGGVFRDVGYAGASMSALAEASGLVKASLYHRFPGGKRQMADEVLADAGRWLADNVLDPLTRSGDPHERLAEALAALDAFYQSGRKGCLLNMLSSPRQDDGPFSPAVKAAIEALVTALASVANDAGLPPADARSRALRSVMLLQGSLVLSRGLGSTDPFAACLKDLPDVLLAPEARS